MIANIEPKAETNGGNEMAGVLKIIARQLQGSRTEDVVSKRVPATKRSRYVAPKVGPEKTSEQLHTKSEGNTAYDLTAQELEALYAAEIVSDKENDSNTTDNIIHWGNFVENASEGAEKGSGTIKKISDATNFINEGNRTQVGNEDYLLNQIDEFREKAQQLQNLLLAKEHKAAELQTLVEEREDKAKELEIIVKERQNQADGLAEEMAKQVTKEVTEEINSQIDTVIGKVTAKLVAMENVIRKDLEEGQNLTEEQFSEILSALEETLPALNTQLEVLKEDLSEKVHSENVKGYRNVSDLIKILEDKMNVLKNTEQNIEKKSDAIHKCVILLVVFSVFNFLGIAGMLLLELGIFQFI